MGHFNIKPIKTTKYGNLFIPLNIQMFSGNLILSNVYETNVDIGSNSSYVHAKLELSVGSNTYNLTGSAYYYINMSSSNNSYGTGNQYIQVPKGYSGTLWEGDLGPFYHNADGSLGAVSINAYAYVVSNTQPTASASCNMSTIPRAPSYNSISASSITETSVRLTANIDTKTLGITGGGWDLSTNGGSTWNYYEGGVTDKTITGLSPNTTYWYRGYCATSGGGSNSSWQTFKTYDYPSCTNSPNFVIGNAVTLSFSNPLGRSISVDILSESNTVLASGTTTGTSLTGFNNATQINNYYSSIPNATSGKYKVRVTYGSSIKTRNNGNTYSVNAINCEPTFNLYTFKDIDSKTLSLTGNNQYCVLGHSDIQATITTSNKAIAKNYATMTNYVFVIGEKSQQADYSENQDVSITIENATHPTFSMYAKDSRGLSKVVALLPSKTIYYEEPTKNILSSSVKRVDSNLQEAGNSEYTLLNISGTIWYNQSGTKGNFGQVTNSITNSYFRYKTSSTSWSNPTSINVTLNDDGTFEYNGLIQGDTLDGFDIANVYTIEVVIEDELSSVTFELTLTGGIPHIAYAKNGVGIMGAYDDNEGGLLQIGGKRFDGLEIYNESQEYVVGKWIDSNDIEYNIYRKTFTASLSNISNNNMTIGFLEGDVKITELKGFIRHVYGNSIKNFVVGENSSIGLIDFETALDTTYDAQNPDVGTNITLRVSSKPSGAQRYTISVIVEYIKIS